MGFGKNYKGVEFFIQAVSLGAWTSYLTVIEKPDRKLLP